MRYLNEFPLFNSKIETISRDFDMDTLEGRKAYFDAKAGPQIGKIKDYLKEASFIAFFLAKKGAGKGTYTKMMVEIFGESLISHISVGDVIRAAHQEIQEETGRDHLRTYLEKNYRGFISVEEALDALEGKNQKTLIPTEFTLAIVKRQIEKQNGKVLFIDGFPRGSDQIPYSLFFKDLVDLRDDPDFFVVVDVPESVIEARIRSRVVCPECQNTRSVVFLPTEHVGYNPEEQAFFLGCDNPKCKKTRMLEKDGDAEGLEAIRDRLKQDGELVEQVMGMHGLDKILLRSSLPASTAEDYCNEYELTKAHHYSLEEDRTITTSTERFLTTDDEGEDIHSLSAPAVVMQLIYQLAAKLEKYHE